MLNLSPKELKAISKIIGIKGYKTISEDELLNALNAPEPLKESEKSFHNAKPKIKFSKPRIEKIRKEFIESRHKLFR